MSRLLITLIAVATPTWLYLRLIYGVDKYEKEPTRYLVAAFLWGAVPAVVVGIIIEIILGIPIDIVLGEESLGGNLVNTAFVPPVVEEILKAGAVAIIYLWRRREFDGWVDGLVYGASAGLGFGYVENVFYLLGTGGWSDWLALFFLRVVVFGFMHGFWTSLTGIGFGLARNSKGAARKTLFISLGLMLAIFSHMLHNSALVLVEQTDGFTFLLALVNYAVLLLLLFGLNLVASHLDRRMLQTYLRDEVPYALSQEAYAMLCSPRIYALNRLLPVSKERRAFIQTAAELAQKKRSLERMGDEGFNRYEINHLRVELSAFGK